MAGAKWQVGQISVTGPAMIGDRNTMQVAADSSTDQASDQPTGELRELLRELRQAVQIAPHDGCGVLSRHEATNLDVAVTALDEELQKEPTAQDGGRLGRCLNDIIAVAEKVPAVLNVAVQVRSLLGI